MTTPTPPKKRRRWRRWLWRLALTAIVARLLLALFLPQVLAVAAHWCGFSLTVRSASLSIAGLSLRLEDFSLGDPARPEAPPLLAAHELVVDASLRDLLRGDVVLVTGALVSARAAVERGADGRWLLPAALTSSASPAPAPATPPAAAPSTPAPLTFAPPVRVVSARVHDLRVSIVDRSNFRPLEYEATIDVDVRDIGAEQPGAVLVRVHAPDWFDTAWLRAEVRTLPALLQVDWRCEVRGLQPARLALPPDVRSLLADVRDIDATLRGSLTGRIDTNAQRREVNGNVRFSVDRDGEERLGWLVAFGPTREEAGAATLPFAVEATVPDCVQSLKVRDAECVYGGGELTVHGHFAMERATLAHLRPLLAARGITMPEAGLGVQAAFDATIGASVSAGLRDVVVQGDGDPVRLWAVQLRDLRASDGGLAIGGIQTNGPELQVARTADGALRVAGVRIAPPPAANGAAATTTAVATAPTLPRLRLGSLDCRGVQLTFHDERLPDAAPLRLDEIAVHGDGITIGADAPPGRLAANVRLVDALESLHLDATITPTAVSLALEAQITGSGLTAKSVAPWLKPLGLTPVLKNGAFACTAGVKLATNAAGFAIDARLADVQLRDGDETLFAIASVTGSGTRFDANTIDLGDWRLEAPLVALQQTVDHHLRALGLEIAPSAAEAPPPTPAPGSPRAPAPVAPPATARPAIELRTGDLGVRGAIVRLTAGGRPPVDIGIDAAVRGAGNAGTIPFEVRAQVASACDRAELRGTIARAARRAEARIEIVGLHGEGLQRLLPPHVRSTLADGSVEGLVHAALPANGQGATFELDGLRLLDRGEELAASDHLLLQIETAKADHLRIVSLDGRGLRAEVAAVTDGLQVPGFVLAPKDPSAPAAAPAPTASPVRIPVLAVDSLSLTCERLVVRDRRGGDGEPLVIAAQVTMDPWQANEDAESSQPAHLHVRASAQPLCGELQIDAAIDPYEQQPTIDLTLRAAPLDLTALQRISPTLAKVVQGTTSTAELSATINARIDLRRRDPRQFDFSRPFGGEFAIDQVRFVDTSTGQPLASVGFIEVAARAIDPRGGDVLLRSVDIGEPHLELTREADGLHCAGLRVILPEPAAAAPPPPGSGGIEFAVDHLHFDGVQVAYRDATTDPPTLLPIADGEVELSRFSTRCLTEPRPFAFNVSLRGGDVPFQRRIVRSSVFAGMIGSAAAAVTGNTEPEIEPRPLFGEFNASGHLQPAPYPRGSMLVNLVAFELVALRGLAKQGGVEISDGLLDYHADLELLGPDGVHASGNTVFTWLSISEPPGGPISTYLRLPAPLQSVLFLLRDEADEHHLPFDFTVPISGMLGGTVRDKVAEAVARIIGDALGSSVARTASIFTGAIGLTGGVHQPLIAAVPFAPGNPLPGTADLSALIAVVADDPQIEIVLTHDLGAGDLAHVEVLATPPREQVAAQAEVLRQRRSTLVATRPALAAAIDSLYAAGRMQEAQVRRAELIVQDERIDDIQRTLERVIDMLANDSPRAAQRRTHEAAIALGTQRLAAVQAAIRRTLPPAAADRVVVRAAHAATSASLTEGGRVVASTRRRIVR